MIPQEEVGGILKLEGDLLEYKLPYWTESKVVILDES